MTKALLIPSEGPLQEVTLDGSLEQLQEIVGGMIEAVRLPNFISGCREATAYINEEGKYLDSCQPNMRATDFMVPGVGLFAGDYIAGPFLLVGFNPRTGEHTEALPLGVEGRARLVDSEA